MTDDYAPFPHVVLPGPMHNFIGEASAAYGVDSAMIALPTLAVLASCVGNSRRVRLKNTWAEPCIVWTATVAASGSLKSPAFRAALAPLQSWQTDEIELHIKAQAAYETEKTKHAAAMAKWKQSPELAEPPSGPSKRTLRRYLINDATIEAAALILQENPRGILLARDELAGWLRSFNAHRKGHGGDPQRWIECFHAQPLTIDRKTEREVVHIPRASVSLTGTVQPEVLRDCLGREHYENGLAARLLLAMPPRRVNRWIDAELDEKTEGRFVELLRGLLALPSDTDLHGRIKPVDVPFDDGGKRAFIAFANQHADEQVLLDGDLAATWSKLQGYAARFALLFHLVRQVSGDATLADPNAIDSISVAAAIQLVRWFGDEAMRIQAVMSEGEDDAHIRRVIEVVRAKGGRVTIRELHRGIMQRMSASEIRGELLAMQSMGYGFLLPVPAVGDGGRSSEMFILKDVAMQDDDLVRRLTNDNSPSPASEAV